MAKRFFTQSVHLLTQGPVTLEAVKAVLTQGGIEVLRESPGADHWALGGPSLLIPFLPEVNGYASLDVVEHRWPDGMGDPKEDLEIFTAWSMSHFGPHVFPGNLARACQFSAEQQKAETLAARHDGFLRIRISYIFGAKGEVKFLPEKYDPLAELTFLTLVTLELLKVPGVIGYFNPNGEVILDPTSFQSIWDGCQRSNLVPLPLWMNTRFLRLSENLAVGESVGNQQLDLPDIEVFYQPGQVETHAVNDFVMGITQFMVVKNQKLASGMELHGPGGPGHSWVAEELEEAYLVPPRPVLRVCPKGKQEEIRDTLATLGK